jgi:hypothetical protein
MAENTENTENTQEQVVSSTVTASPESNEEKHEEFDSRWDISVYRGQSATYKHKVFVVKIKSKLLDAEKSFYLNDFMLKFNKTVKPFMSLVGIVKESVENELQTLVNDIISKEAVNDYDNIDSLLENASQVSNEDAKTYLKNISYFVNKNKDLFAVKEDKSDNSDIPDKTFNPKVHYGAYLKNAYYKEKFGKEKSNADEDLLAVCISKLKTMSDINDNHRIKDVVAKFVENKYILTGNGSTTIEKDLTLSRGNEVRCYVLDMAAIKEISEGNNAANSEESSS